MAFTSKQPLNKTRTFRDSCSDQKYKVISQTMLVQVFAVALLLLSSVFADGKSFNCTLFKGKPIKERKAEARSNVAVLYPCSYVKAQFILEKK